MQEIKAITRYRAELHDKILDAAMTLFAAQGIKAVRMDDIARQLNISKRTLYEIYENKEALLYEGMKRYKTRKEQETQWLLSECQNVMDVILRSYLVKIGEFKQTCQQFYEEITKYPRVLELLHKDREGQRQRAIDIFQRGVKEGYFRGDIDIVLVTRLFDAEAQFIMTNQVYKDYSIEVIFRSIVFVSLRGICTRKGADALEEFLYGNELT